MKDKNDSKLSDVQETLLLPLWGRAMEMQKTNPLLRDEKALSLINTIKYDFSRFEKDINKFSRDSWIARSIYFDQEIKKFIKINENATIINIGCGLDTTFERLDNGKIAWYDLDLPEVIEMRKNYFKASSRYKMISKSVFDYSWFDAIHEKNNILIMLAGVIYYFDENQIKELIIKIKEKFEKVNIIFDYCSDSGLKMANKNVIEKGDMSKKSYLKWSINNIKDLTKIDKDIEIMNNQPMFKDFKKNLVFYKRYGHQFSDILRIMSLAHIEIER